MGNGFGLALSGGGARGFAHIGVLQALDRRLRPDFIAGTSMGAVIAALYAARLDVAWVERVARDFARRSLRLLWDWKPSRGGLLSGRHAEEFLRGHLGGVQFSGLKLPIAVTATDLRKGASVVIRDGDVVSALRASVSIPGLLAPVSRRVAGEDLFLVDGGVSDPLPVGAAHQQGCAAVLAVSANPDYLQPTVDPRSLHASEITMRSFYIMQRFITVQKLEEQDTFLELHLRNCPFLDFSRLDPLIEQGRVQTDALIPALQERLRGARPVPLWRRLAQRLRGLRGRP